MACLFLTLIFVDVSSTQEKDILPQVLDLKSAGVSDEVIQAFIEAKSEYRPLTVTEILTLKKLGVGDNVLQLLAKGKRVEPHIQYAHPDTPIPGQGEANSISNPVSEQGNLRVSQGVELRFKDGRPVRNGMALVRFEALDFWRYGIPWVYVDDMNPGLSERWPSTHSQMHWEIEVAPGAHIAKIVLEAKYDARSGGKALQYKSIAGKPYSQLVKPFTAAAGETIIIRDDASIRGVDPATGEMSPDPLAPEIRIRK